MATGERHLTDGAATARWLGESGELVSRYQAAVGEHVGRMATVNADLRAELAGARTAAARLRDVLAFYADPANWEPFDFYWIGDTEEAGPRAVGDRGERARVALAEGGKDGD